MQKVKDKEVVVYNVKVFGMRRTIFIMAQAKYKRIRFLFQDYSLDKSCGSWSNPLMDSNYFFFKGLAVVALAFRTFRMSFLMLANKDLVGTFLISFFLPSSNGASL